MNIHEACITYLSYVRDVKQLSPLTIKAYQQDLDLLAQILGHQTSFDSVSRDCIRQVVAAMFAKDQSKASVKRRIACYRTMFSWFESEKLINQSPFYKLNLKIKLPHRLPRNLTSQELTSLRCTAIGNVDFDVSVQCRWDDAPRKIINHICTLIGIELLLTTGLRISELTSIRINDIHLSEEYIHIRGKGQRERRVFITTENIRNLICNYLLFRKKFSVENDNFLINKLGKPVTSQTFRLWVRALGKKAKLSRIATPHMYRHSAATHLIEAGVDIRFVQRLLGHQSITTTQLYTHVNDSELQKTIKAANIQGRVL